MAEKNRICNIIEEKREYFAAISDQIWGYAETRFQLSKSADLLCRVLREGGVEVQRGCCGMKDAVVATWGGGSPVIGILGEYDALPNLSQASGVAKKQADRSGAPGHGCGHNLLGVGALAGAVAIQQYLKETGIGGTIKFFGCPAEESGSGKAFMARGGAFDGLDSDMAPDGRNRYLGNQQPCKLSGLFQIQGNQRSCGSLAGARAKRPGCRGTNEYRRQLSARAHDLGGTHSLCLSGCRRRVS